MAGAALVMCNSANAAKLSAASATQYAQGTYPEYFDLLKLPNDAIVPADVRKKVEFLDAAFRKRGFITKQLKNDGKPMLFAEQPNADPKRKTVLFYMHLDGQPVVPEQWDQRDPWEPVLKRRTTDDKWEEVDSAKLFNGSVDPEWRVFGRSSADDKAPIMMLFTRWMP
ncbi:hypothetical protein [Psychrobacter maritimus]|uniref:hypothetical protein n=1 Tax=Psychrobacter maritimus TaxID=256325 RepID=UPI003FD4CDF5